jgi:hypothetical protein
MEFKELEIRQAEISKVVKLVENYCKVYTNPNSVMKELAYSGWYSEEALCYAEDMLEDLMEFQGDRAPVNSDRFYQGVRYYYDTISKTYSAPSVGIYNQKDPSVLKSKILQISTKRNELKTANKKSSAAKKVKKQVSESILTKEFIENLRTQKRNHLNQVAENTVEELKNYFLESEYAFTEAEAYEMLESLNKEEFEYFLNEYKQTVAKKKSKSLIFPEVPPSSSAIPYSTPKTEAKGICKGCMKESKLCSCSVDEEGKFKNNLPSQPVKKIANGHNQLADNNGKLVRTIQQTEEVKDEERVETLGEKCWKGYVAKGMKSKSGKMVPDCRPVNSGK